MADNDQKNNDQAQQSQVPPAVTPQRANQQAIIEVAALVERMHLDETVPGGRYLVNGIYVDADGNKHKDQKSE